MLLLLRHGQIKANRQCRWHGSTDSKLTWRGRLQARQTARHLQQNNVKIHKIVSSPLMRCQATAGYVATTYDMPVDTESRISEMSIGEWEGLPFNKLQKEHELFSKLNNDRDYQPPGGESLNQVADRVTAAFIDLDSNYREQNILVVSHGVALAVDLATLVEGSPAYWGNYQFNNCSLTEFHVQPPQVSAFNQHAHLS